MVGQRKKADSRKRVVGVRMNTNKLASIARAAKREKDREGDPLRTSTFIRDVALRDADKVLAAPPSPARIFVLRVRMSDDERERLKLAAALCGEHFSNYMLECALRHIRNSAT